MQKICKFCGKEFKAKKKTQQTCNRECFFNWYRRNRVELICERCGEVFYKNKGDLGYPGRGRYCSWKCRRNRITRICDQCGESYEIVGSAKKHSRFCSLNCRDLFRSIHYRGKGHPLYKGKGFNRLYTNDFNAILKALIRERDCNSCVLCGNTRKNLRRALSCHHIDYDKYNNSFNNLVSLCDSCHSKTNYNRKNWTSILTNKINSMPFGGFACY